MKFTPGQKVYKFYSDSHTFEAFEVLKQDLTGVVVVPWGRMLSGYQILFVNTENIEGKLFVNKDDVKRAVVNSIQEEINRLEALWKSI